MLVPAGNVFLLRAALRILLYLCLYPFRQIASFLRKIVKKVWTNMKKTIANRRKKVYNISKVKQVMKQAERGFLTDTAFVGKETGNSV